GHLQCSTFRGLPELKPVGLFQFCLSAATSDVKCAISDSIIDPLSQKANLYWQGYIVDQRIAMNRQFLQVHVDLPGEFCQRKASLKLVTTSAAGDIVRRLVKPSKRERDQMVNSQII